MKEKKLDTTLSDDAKYSYITGESYKNIQIHIEKLPIQKTTPNAKNHHEIILKLPNSKNFKSIPKIKKKLLEIIKKSLKPKIEDIFFPSEIPKISISFIKPIKTYFIIGLKTGLLFFYDLYEKKLIKFIFCDKIKKKPKSFSNILIDYTEKRFFTLGENEKIIFIWCLNKKKNIDFIEEKEEIKNMILTKEKLYYAINNKIIITNLKNFQKKIFGDENIENFIRSIQIDFYTNLIYIIRKNGLEIYDLITKLKIKNFHYFKDLLTTKFDLQPIMFIDEGRGVLIFSSSKKIVFLSLYNFKIIKEHYHYNKRYKNLGYYDKDFNVFFLYRKEKKKFLFFFDYKTKPISIDLNLPFLKQNNYMNTFYDENLKKIILSYDDNILSYDLHNFERINLFKTNKLIKSVKSFCDKKIIFWESDKIISSDEIKIDGLSEKGKIVIYDMKKNKIIKKLHINFKVNNFHIDCENYIVYLSGNGIMKYEVDKNILKKLEGVNYDIKTKCLVLDKILQNIYFIQQNILYCYNIKKKFVIKMGENFSKNLLLDEERNILYSSGKNLLAWDLKKKEKYIIDISEYEFFDLMSIDKKNNLIYVSKGSDVLIWDLENYKELGILIRFFKKVFLLI